MAKLKHGAYCERWYKIRNPNYSQYEGRRELFEKRHSAFRAYAVWMGARRRAFRPGDIVSTFCRLNQGESSSGCDARPTTVNGSIRTTRSINHLGLERHVLV